MLRDNPLWYLTTFGALATMRINGNWTLCDSDLMALSLDGRIEAETCASGRKLGSATPHQSGNDIITLVVKLLAPYSSAGSTRSENLGFGPTLPHAKTRHVPRN